MKRLTAFAAGLLIAGSFALSAPPAAAQITATVVTACGTPPSTYHAGQPKPVTQDTTGKLCDNGGGGGGGVAGFTAEATASAVAAGTNKPASEDTTNGGQRVVIMTPGSTAPVDLSAAGSGIGATAATVPPNAVFGGCRAASAAPTAVTDGQLVGQQCGLEGKTVVLPYSIKETAVRGSTGAVTNTSQTSIIASAGGSLKNYITAIQCANSGATTSILTFTDAAATILINPAGGGGNWQFPIPLVTAAATAFQVTPGSSSTSQYCSAQGYTGL